MCHRKHALKLFILLEQNAGAKLDTLPSYELANKPSDQTFDAVCIGLFVVRIRFPFLALMLVVVNKCSFWCARMHCFLIV